MKYLRLFVADQWRLFLFFILGFLFILGVIVLSLAQRGIHVAWMDIGYAFLLALVCLCVSELIEFMIRWPFYREAMTRLDESSNLHGATTFPTPGTAEQRLFLKLLQHYYTKYAEEVGELADRHRFNELFATRFAHQMKTPITVIQLLEQELRQHVKLREEDPDVQNVLDSLTEECNRLDESVSMLLATARLQSFSFDAHMESVEVLTVLREVINAHKSAWIRKRIYPVFHCADESITVATDKKWITFVFEQIIHNALQYGRRMDASTKEAEVADEAVSFIIEVSRHQHSVQIHFTDSGIGIPARDLQRVFDPFFTGGNGRTHSRATGMGLYLTRQVLNRLGHTITLSSQEGVGTTVCLSITDSEYFEPMNAATQQTW